MQRIAKVFKKFLSKSVRLPSRYNSDGSEVHARFFPATVGVRRPEPWIDLFNLMKTIEVPKDFLADREDAPPQEREPLENRIIRRALDEKSRF